MFVQTAKKKQEKTVFGVRYKFIKVRPQKLTGIEISGFGNHAFRVTDKEKTIADCFDLPEYGGEFPCIIRAFVRNKWNQQKLIAYCSALNNNSAIKRMGYIAEIYGLPMNRFIAFAKTRVNKTVSLFNPFGDNRGNIVTNWGLKLNIQKDDILAMINY